MDPAERKRETGRIASAGVVVALHMAALVALITGRGAQVVHDADRELVVITLPAPPAPIRKEKPAPATAKPRRASAPRNLRADPTPIVIPPPVLRPPLTPIIAAPVAGMGAQSDAGSSDRAGPGHGAGGDGDGLGAGGGMDARQVRGEFRDSDYPRAAHAARIGGTVVVRFMAEADGSVSGCRVTESSGNAELDEITCRVIMRRFRFDPARDAAGRPIAALQEYEERWWLEDR